MHFTEGIQYNATGLFYVYITAMSICMLDTGKYVEIELRMKTSEDQLYQDESCVISKLIFY